MTGPAGQLQGMVVTRMRMPLVVGEKEDPLGRRSQRYICRCSCQYYSFYICSFVHPLDSNILKTVSVSVAILYSFLVV